MLKLNGQLLLTVPFVWNEHEVPYDFGRYTSFGISDLLTRNGFEIIEQRKSTTYVEVLATMSAEYIRFELAKHIKNPYINLICCTVFIAPISFLGLILNKILPENDSFYCDNIVLAKKIA